MLVSRFSIECFAHEETLFPLLYEWIKIYLIICPTCPIYLIYMLWSLSPLLRIHSNLNTLFIIVHLAAGTIVVLYFVFRISSNFDWTSTTIKGEVRKLSYKSQNFGYCQVEALSYSFGVRFGFSEPYELMCPYCRIKEEFVSVNAFR